MGLFGGGNSKSDTTNNTLGSEASYDNNQGDIAYGNQSNTNITTDHGAVQSSLANALASAQSALAANAKANDNVADIAGASLLASDSAIKTVADISKSSLLANNANVAAVLSANQSASKDSLEFGAKSLDFGSYTVGKNADLAEKTLAGVMSFSGEALETNANLADNALGKVADSANSVINSISSFAKEILVNGEKATSGALQFAKETNRSDSANQAELMIKAVSVLGIVAVLAFAFGGKK